MKQKQTHRHRGQTRSYWGETGGGEGRGSRGINTEVESK